MNARRSLKEFPEIIEKVDKYDAKEEEEQEVEDRTANGDWSIVKNLSNPSNSS